MKKEFDRYAYYLKAVQSPETDCEFISNTFKELRGVRPREMREDFCGTFANSCAWVKGHKANRAVGVDLDPEPLAYGKRNYFPQLSDDQQSRLRIVQGNVMTVSLPAVDVIIAMNFSYYLFKTRMLLRRYFSKAYRGLKSNGLFIVDAFGGSECYGANVERSRIGGRVNGFDYFWEQEGFDPVTNEAKFHIHFKRDGEGRRDKIFSYDWRMWSIPEIREVMTEAGFARTHVYWEGTTKSGEGDGNFKRVEKGEECEAWVAYIVGEV